MSPTSASLTPGDACCKCAYSLDTLSPSGVCPECGTPIRESLVFFLRNASPNYIRQIDSGLGFITHAPVFKILAGILWGIMLTVDGDMKWWPAAAMVAAFAVGWTGYWKLASPDWQLTEAQDNGSMRRWIRPSLAVHAGALVLWLIAKVIEFDEILPFDLVEPASYLILAVVMVSGFILDLSALTHARRIATRIPDRGFVKLVRPMQWVVMLLPITVPCVGAIAATLTLTFLTNRLRASVSPYGTTDTPPPHPHD